MKKLRLNARSKVNMKATRDRKKQQIIKKKREEKAVENNNNNNNNNMIMLPLIPQLVVPMINNQEKSKPQSSSKYDHLWEYSDNGWKNYDQKAGDILEEVYLKYLANRGDTDVRAVKSGQWEYQVDFMALKQTNIQHPNHTVRDIRRVAL